MDVAGNEFFRLRSSECRVAVVGFNRSRDGAFETERCRCSSGRGRVLRPAIQRLSVLGGGIGRSDFEDGFFGVGTETELFRFGSRSPRLQDHVSTMALSIEESWVSSMSLFEELYVRSFADCAGFEGVRRLEEHYDVLGATAHLGEVYCLWASGKVWRTVSRVSESVGLLKWFMSAGRMTSEVGVVGSDGVSLWIVHAGAKMTRRR